MGTIRVGTAGWSDKSLVAAGWYPRGVHTPEQRLRSYAERFDFVEVNSTYYGLPAESTGQAWADRTPPEFTFNVKAFSLLTQHRTRTAMLPADLRPADKNTVQQRDLAPDVVDEVWQRFLGPLTALHEAGKLGLLLFQFPPWFRPGEQAREYLLQCRQRCSPMRMCVEFRTPAWLDESTTMDFLRQNDIPYVCVDMPQGLPESVPPVLAVTSTEAVVRLHGQSRLWTTGTKEERYRHRYDEAELSLWAQRVQWLQAQAETTYVVFNNCYRDDAHVNAAQLHDLLVSTTGR